METGLLSSCSGRIPRGSTGPIVTARYHQTLPRGLCHSSQRTCLVWQYAVPRPACRRGPLPTRRQTVTHKTNRCLRRKETARFLDPSYFFDLVRIAGHKSLFSDA